METQGNGVEGGKVCLSPMSYLSSLSYHCCACKALYRAAACQSVINLGNCSHSEQSSLSVHACLVWRFLESQAAISQEHSVLEVIICSHIRVHQFCQLLYSFLFFSFLSLLSFLALILLHCCSLSPVLIQRR